MEETCICGRVWNLRRIKLPQRDRDSFNCVCGNELKSWNGGQMWTGTLISEPAPKPKTTQAKKPVNEMDIVEQMKHFRDIVVDGEKPN